MRKNVLRRVFLTAGLFLTAAPVFLLAGAFLTASRTASWLLPLAAAMTAAFAARMLPSRVRLAGTSAAVLVSGAAGWSFCRFAGIPAWSPLAAAMCAAAAAAGVLLLSRQRDSFNPAILWALGYVIYIAARFIGAMASLDALPVPLRQCMACHIVFSLPAFSLQSLTDGTGGGKDPSRSMVLRNLAAAAGLSALTLFLANLDAAGRALRRFLSLIARFFACLSSLLPSLSEPQGTPGTGGMFPVLPDIPEQPAGMSLFEKVLRFICLAAAAAAALFLAAILVRGILRLLRRLAKWLRRYAGTVTEAYDDTVESLLDWEEVRAGFSMRLPSLPRLRKGTGGPAEPRDQLRRSYRVFLSRHPEIPTSRTARESLDDAALASLYEKARYSRETISAEDAREGRRIENK